MKNAPMVREHFLFNHPDIFPAVEPASQTIPCLLIQASFYSL
jgi:hypothetical protein